MIAGKPRECLAVAIVAFALGAVTLGEASARAKAPFHIASAQLEPVAFGDIEGWLNDDHAEAFATFLASCRAILKSTRALLVERPPIHGALHEICQRAVASLPLDDARARGFFERNFRAYRIAPLGEPQGFITGYYEPIFEGARLPSEQYSVPLYRRPPDLLLSRLRRHRVPKGKAAWRKARLKTAPYFERAQIEDGILAGRQLEICYLKDPIDAFFAQIQGSARIRLEDGEVLRLNYDASNGHPYVAVGRFLIERDIIAKDEMSMQRIREWMQANPEDAKALRRENKSYVFFRETNLDHYDEAIGAQGISLAANRSIAVDKAIHVYGTPFFIDADLPIASEKPETKFRRLMIAQDTGGAIVGPARADIYLGAGAEAARAAGRFKQYGRFVMLIPASLDPAAAVAGIPLPRQRPQIGRRMAGPQISKDRNERNTAAEIKSQPMRTRPARLEK